MLKLSDGSNLTHDQVEKVGPAPRGEQPFKQTFYWHPPLDVRRLLAPIEQQHARDEISVGDLDSKLSELLLGQVDRELVEEAIAGMTVADVDIDWKNASVKSLELQPRALVIPTRWTAG